MSKELNAALDLLNAVAPSPEARRAVYTLAMELQSTYEFTDSEVVIEVVKAILNGMRYNKWTNRPT